MLLSERVGGRGGGGGCRGTGGKREQHRCDLSLSTGV